MDQNLINLEILPKDSKVTIQISTDLYVRLQQLLLEGLPHKDLADLQNTLKLVKDNKAESGIPYHTHSLLHLLSLIETSARDAKLTQQKQFNLAEKKLVD